MKDNYLRKMFDWLLGKKKVTVDNSIFPTEVLDIWLAGQKGKWKYKMPYFVGKEYQEYRVGQVVHLLARGNRRGFYKIVEIRRPYGDYATWDDGKKYDFEFVFSKRKYNKR